MFINLLRTLSRATVRYKRFITSYCPTEPFDPNVQVTYLPNGVRVMTEEAYSPLACVSLFVVAGSKYESAKCNGISHFIEHLAYKGFRTLNRIQLEHDIFDMGAKLTVKTMREMQVFSISLPSKLAPEGMGILFKIVKELAFDQCEIESALYNMSLETADLDNKPKAVVFDNLHATAFQGTSLGQPVIGPLRNRVKFDKDVAAAFLSKHYVTCSQIVATSGGVSHDVMLKKAGETFGNQSPGSGCNIDEGTSRFTSSEIVYRDDSMPFAHVALAVEAPGYNSEDYWTMLVASCLIGSWDKSQGRLEYQPFYVAQGASVGECYSYESFYMAYRDVGLWGAYFVADKFKLDEMIFLIQHAWMQMSVHCHTMELKKAKNIAKMKVARRYDGVVNSCFDMGIQMLYASRRRSFETAMDCIDRVGPYMLRNLGQKYLYNQGPVLSAVGPTEALPEFNRTISGMYWLRL